MQSIAKVKYAMSVKQTICGEGGQSINLIIKTQSAQITN
jgi:hypothetical protein